MSVNNILRRGPPVAGKVGKVNSQQLPGRRLAETGKHSLQPPMKVVALDGDAQKTHSEFVWVTIAISAPIFVTFLVVTTWHCRGMVREHKACSQGKR